MIKVIAYYTEGTKYRDEAVELVKTLLEYDVDHETYSCKNYKSWELNCAMKPFVLRKAIEETSSNILYLDVDARLERKPNFSEIEKDKPGFFLWYAPYIKGLEMLSGTMYFPNNDLSRKILTAWCKEQNKTPKEWDQRVLQRTIFENDFDFYNLPIEWISIPNHSEFPKVSLPYVTHGQASRRLKNTVK